MYEELRSPYSQGRTYGRTYDSADWQKKKKLKDRIDRAEAHRSLHHLIWFLQIWMNVKSRNTIATAWRIVTILWAHSIALVFKDLQETVSAVLVWYMTDSTFSNMSQLNREYPVIKTSDFLQPSNEMYNLRQYCIILLFTMHKRLFPNWKRAVDEEILAREKKTIWKIIKSISPNKLRNMLADISLNSMCVPKLQVSVVLALENWYLLNRQLFDTLLLSSYTKLSVGNGCILL